MITKSQRKNAERIVELADAFGHLPYNAHGQTPESLINLSIPVARLILAGIVTGVVDSFDAVNDQAVEDVERYCRVAVDRAIETHGHGWWVEDAQRFNLVKVAA
jgi:hypothetical protein